MRKEAIKMSNQITNEELAQAIKITGAEERRKILDRQNKLLTEQLREKIRRKYQEEDIQTIIDDVFAEPRPEAKTGTITMFASDGVLGKANPHQLSPLRRFINSHKKK